MNKKKDEKWFSEERRKYQRIDQSFVMTFYELDYPGDRHEITQLKNISLGGMRFISSKALEAGADIRIELVSPHTSGTTTVMGKVLESIEKVTDMLYEIRLQYDPLEPDVEFVLNKLIEFFAQGDRD